MESALAITGLALGVLSLIYAVVTNREKAKLERLIEVRLQDVVASIDKVNKNTQLAYSHLDPVRRFLQKLAPSDELATVLDQMTWLHGDVTAADRLIERMRNDVTALQSGLYGTKSVHQEQKSPTTTAPSDHDAH